MESRIPNLSEEHFSWHLSNLLNKSALYYTKSLLFFSFIIWSSPLNPGHYYNQEDHNGEKQRWSNSVICLTCAFFSVFHPLQRLENLVHQQPKFLDKSSNLGFSDVHNPSQHTGNHILSFITALYPMGYGCGRRNKFREEKSIKQKLTQF